MKQERRTYQQHNITQENEWNDEKIAKQQLSKNISFMVVYKQKKARKKEWNGRMKRRKDNGKE